MLLIGVISIISSLVLLFNISIDSCFGFSDFSTSNSFKNKYNNKNKFKTFQILFLNNRRYNNKFNFSNKLSFVSNIFKIDDIVDHTGRFSSKLGSFPHSGIIKIIKILTFSVYKSRPPDLASLLLSERIVYIGYPIQQTVAHLVISQLLYLDYDSQEKPIKIYINSDNDQSKDSGLSTSEIDALNIVDVINYLKNEVITINLGKAYGPAAVILASGTPGKRYVLPRSYTLLRQSPTTIPFSQAEDIAIYSDEILKARKSIIKVLSKACNKEESEILEKINIGDYMDSQDTVNFGLADNILEDIK